MLDSQFWGTRNLSKTRLTYTQVFLCNFVTSKFFRLQRTHSLQNTSWVLLLYHKFSLTDAPKKSPVSDDSEFNKIKTLPTYCRRSVPKSTSQEAFSIFLICNTAFPLFPQVIFASVSSTNFLISVDCCFSLVHLI